MYLWSWIYGLHRFPVFRRIVKEESFQTPSRPHEFLDERSRHRHGPIAFFLILTVSSFAVLTNVSTQGAEQAEAKARQDRKSGEAVLEWIIRSKDGSQLVRAKSETAFKVWGVNYDHDRDGRLIEDYWKNEWATVVEDFKEIRALGANVVRVHLQTGKFMDGPRKPNAKALKQLARLVKLAEQTKLYLNITGLGCYHRKDIPEWYDALPEAGRWETQALFWKAVAEVGAGSPAVFCYDLMNEPILAGEEKKEKDWLAGEFAGKHFVQRITLGLAGRTRKEIAKAWIDKLVLAIREHDQRHLITVGVIPWAHTWPNAKPLFYSNEVCANLDFVSVHFYPEKGKVDKALKALAVYDIGKPLVIEEIFPLKCSAAELDDFIRRSRKFADGWTSFYWGKTIEEYGETKDSDLGAAITGEWLQLFRKRAPEILESNGKASP